MAKPGDSKFTKGAIGQKAATEADVADYNILEQNTERVSIMEITKRAEYAPALSGISKKDKIEALKTFLMSGQKFSEAIKAARSGGKRFIRYQNIVLNIQTDPAQILVSKFTKRRFLEAEVLRSVPHSASSIRVCR